MSRPHPPLHGAASLVRCGVALARGAGRGWSLLFAGVGVGNVVKGVSPVRGVRPYRQPLYIYTALVTAA